MAPRIFILIILAASTTWPPASSAQKLKISRNHSGGITIYDYRKHDDDEKHDEEVFPLLSQVSTGLSLFTTSILFATGYSEDKIISDFGRFIEMTGSDTGSRKSIYAGEILLLMGTLTASIFSYSFGFENDLLAIIPVLPVEVSTGNNGSTHGMSEQQIRLQFGLYFYFSRDF